MLAQMIRVRRAMIHDPREGGRAYLVSSTGRVDLHGLYLAPCDGAVISGESQFAITAIDASRGEK
jgi:hypothetical protein